jgi:hypothetical protein
MLSKYTSVIVASEMNTTCAILDLFDNPEKLDKGTSILTQLPEMRH